MAELDDDRLRGVAGGLAGDTLQMMAYTAVCAVSSSKQKYI